MKEDFLHYIWKYQLFSIKNLKTSAGEELIIIGPGSHNSNNGPDFLNVKIKINNQLWVGNIEIHLRSSDWYAHNHEQDANYDAIILHIVWEEDVPIFMKNDESLPTLILKDFIDRTIFDSYRKLFDKQQKWIPCENNISQIDDFVFNNWKERLFFERLERKANEINGCLIENKNNFEAVLFQLLAKNFGLKVNGEGFLALAKSIDFQILKKLRFDQTQLSAYIFGQAGFLEDNIESDYYNELKTEYRFLKHKYGLSPISKNNFSFFRMRPSNFPTIRLTQLIGLYNKHQNLFSKLIEIKNLKDFYKIFDVQTHSFWKTHYTFEKKSKAKSIKITPQFIDLLLINTIIPLKFLYKKNKGEANESSFLDILKQIKPEKNNIINKFKEVGIKAKSAYETQALIELKNNYCSKKLCLKCSIGNSLLQKKLFRLKRFC